MPDFERLARLQDFFAEHRSLPSYAGIAELMDYGSKAAAYKLVTRLSDAGFLKKGPGRRLAPTDQFFERRLAGAVRAGLPDMLPEVECENVTIDDYLIDKPSQQVLVRVKGDSMIEAGILHGDLVVVDRSREAKRGDIVVALWDGEVTIKELDYERDRAVLRPRNKTMPVLRPEEDFLILGVYVGLVRRLARN